VGLADALVIDEKFGINHAIAEKFVILDGAAVFRFRIVEAVAQRFSVKGHLLDTVDNLGRLDTGGLEDGRGNVNDLAVLSADLAMVFLVDALSPAGQPLLPELLNSRRLPRRSKQAEHDAELFSNF